MMRKAIYSTIYYGTTTSNTEQCTQPTTCVDIRTQTRDWKTYSLRSYTQTRGAAGVEAAGVAPPPHNPQRYPQPKGSTPRVPKLGFHEGMVHLYRCFGAMPSRAGPRQLHRAPSLVVGPKIHKQRLCSRNKDIVILKLKFNSFIPPQKPKKHIYC